MTEKQYLKEKINELIDQCDDKELLYLIYNLLCT